MIQTLFVVGIILVISYVIAGIVSAVATRSGETNALLWAVVAGGIGLTLHNAAVLPMSAVYALVIVPLAIFLVVTGFVVWTNHRVLSGAYGQESKWTAELVREGDAEFARAVDALPDYEVRDAGIIADSKDELREVVVKRYDELTE